VEISEQAAGKVRRRIQDMAGRAIIRISEGFFDMAERTLSVKARDDGTAAPDCEYSDALDQLKQHRETIKGGFLERVISQIEEVSDLESVIDQRRRRASSHSEKSSVGESDGFKEWLVMAEIIAKAENRFCDELFEIQTHMGLIAKPWGHKDAVPVGPATLSWAFNAAVEGLDIGRRARQDILRCFEKAMNRVLENFYAELNSALASALEKELQ
jgi:hypothetical protein